MNLHVGVYTINKDVIRHIRAIEASLKEALNYDDCNAFHIAKMLNKDACHNALKDCVLSKYCVSIYEEYIFPLYFYLEYSNNYLSIEKIASDKGVNYNQAQKVINKGRDIINAIN